MTVTDLLLFALVLLLCGGFNHIADRCRELLDILRPRQPIDMPIYTRRSLYEAPKPGEKERELAGEKEFPPPPPPGYFEEPNPDHRVYDTDKELGGVASHVPPIPANGEEEENPF